MTPTGNQKADGPNPLVPSLGPIFAPSIGLEGIITHIGTLTKFIRQVLNDTQKSLSLLNTKMSPRRKAVLQNRMVLDLLLRHKEPPVPVSKQNIV